MGVVPDVVVAVVADAVDVVAFNPLDFTRRTLNDRPGNRERYSLGS